MVSIEAQTEIDRLFSSRAPVELPLAERRQNWERDALLEPLPEGARLTSAVVGGVASEWMEMPGARRVFLLLHGGGYTNGSPRTHRKLAAHIAQATGMRVLTPQYRLAPEHRFPAAVEDAMAAYRGLLGLGFSADDIVIGGDSAGGGLALSLLLALRRDGMAMPRAAVLLAPWTDLSASSPSYIANRDLDPIISQDRLAAAGLMYAGSGGPRDPMASPLFADLAGLPPLLMHAGGSETMVDDSRLFADRAAAGVRVIARVWPGLWHVFHTAAPKVPEARAAIEEIGVFVRAVLSG